MCPPLSTSLEHRPEESGKRPPPKTNFGGSLYFSWNVLGWHWLISLYRFQVRISTIHDLAFALLDHCFTGVYVDRSFPDLPEKKCVKCLLPVSTSQWAGHLQIWFCLKVSWLSAAVLWETEFREAPADTTRVLMLLMPRNKSKFLKTPTLLQENNKKSDCGVRGEAC